jgi:hypothetical protein
VIISKKCQNCGEIATQEASVLSCPSCKAFYSKVEKLIAAEAKPAPEKLINRKRKILAPITIGFIALATLAVSIYLAYPIYKNDQIISAAKKVVDSTLKDPASAQYKSEFISSDKTIVCGEVNAKNSLGGYVGFKRYLSRGQQILIEDGSFTQWDLEVGPAKPTDKERILLLYTEKFSSGMEIYEDELFASRKKLFNWIWENSCK